MTLICLLLPVLAHAYGERPFEIEHGPPGIADLSALIRDGKWQEAVERGYALLDSTEAEYGPASLEAALVMDRLVEALWRSGDVQNPDALVLAERALAIEERVLGPDHPEVSHSLQTWGNLLSKRGDFEGAEAKFQQALEIREQVHGPVHVRVAGTLNDLGIVVARQGDYPRAIAILERTLAIREEHLEPDHREMAEIMGNLGYAHDAAGNYRVALGYTRRALEIMETIEGPSHPVVIGMQMNIAISYLRLGDYDRAQEGFDNVLAAAEASFGPDHRRVAEAHHNVASVALQVRGDYNAARRHNEACIDILARTLGPRHPVIIRPTHLGAEILVRLGDLDRALLAYEEALSVAEEAYGDEHPLIATVLRSRGEVYLRAGRLDEAEESLTHALTVSEATRGPSHSGHAAVLSSLGDLARRQGDFERALDYAVAAHQTCVDAMGSEGILTLSALERVAVLQYRTGREDEAVTTLDEVVSGFEALLGPDHPQVGEALVHQARFLRSTDPDRAFALALRAEAIGREHQRFITRALPESDALRFAGVRNSGRDIVLTIAREDPEAERIESACDAVIRSRAVVLDEMAARHRALAAATDPDLAALQEAERRARARLANLVLMAPKDMNPTHHRRLLEEARRERDAAERAVADAGAGLEAGSIGIEDIRSGLMDGRALVSFVRYEDLGETGETPSDAYLAFVLRSGRGVDLVPLGDGSDIDGAVKRWHHEISVGPFVADRTPEQADAAYEASARDLASLVWEPLRAHLTDSEWVYVVPDGLLHLVNFGVLPSGSTAYLIEDDVTLHVLTTERDLAPAPWPEVGEGLLAFGAPEFDTDCALLSASLATAETAADAGDRVAAVSFRGASPACPEFRDVRFTPLPASAVEVTGIAELWNTSEARGHGIAVTGKAANEAAFKALVPGHRVLHVATHGFFVPEECDRIPGTSERGIGGMQPSMSDSDVSAPMVAADDAFPPSANPLVLSGIVLAGANTRSPETATEYEDGILTAEEIAALDLSGVEWAVLSACETGLGEIHDAEGVLGLRRSFQVAGTHTVIMSLWPVMDESAHDWMTRFYRARLESGLTTAESVREASRGALVSRRESGETTHPYYWAGFVAAGDWR